MSFDRLAPHYDWMERVLAGEKLQRMRTRWLDEIPIPRRALLVGEGHGRFLVELCRRAPAAEIVCVDASTAMLSVARRRLEHAGLSAAAVRLVRADLPDGIALAGTFDLIVTNFFLDCFPPDQLALVIEQLASLATGDAQWLVADFRVPDRGPARLRARCLLALMYAFFRPTTRLPARTLTPPDPLLFAHGFRLRQRHEADWGLLHADWWGKCHSDGTAPCRIDDETVYLAGQSRPPLPP